MPFTGIENMFPTDGVTSTLLMQVEINKDLRREIKNLKDQLNTERFYAGQVEKDHKKLSAKQERLNLGWEAKSKEYDKFFEKTEGLVEKTSFVRRLMMFMMAVYFILICWEIYESFF